MVTGTFLESLCAFKVFLIKAVTNIKYSICVRLIKWFGRRVMEKGKVKEYTIEREYLGKVSLEELLVEIIKAHLNNRCIDVSAT